jgi:hypothetical protein
VGGEVHDLVLTEREVAQDRQAGRVAEAAEHARRR